MNIVLGLILLLVAAILIIFLLCYKIPQVLQVLLLRSMRNKVVERGYISRLRRFKDNVISRFCVSKSRKNAPTSGK